MTPDITEDDGCPNDPDNPATPADAEHEHEWACHKCGIAKTFDEATTKAGEQALIDELVDAGFTGVEEFFTAVHERGYHVIADCASGRIVTVVAGETEKTLELETQEADHWMHRAIRAEDALK